MGLKKEAGRIGECFSYFALLWLKYLSETRKGRLILTHNFRGSQSIVLCVCGGGGTVGHVEAPHHSGPRYKERGRKWVQI